MPLVVSLPDSFSTTMQMISGKEKVYLEIIYNGHIREEIHKKVWGKTSEVALKVDGVI